MRAEKGLFFFIDTKQNKFIFTVWKGILFIKT
jgi:hypothetical protein